MFLNIWAYLLATIGVGYGIFAFHRKKWKIGAWVTCISLLIVVGGNINIEQIIPSISDSFNFTQELKDIRSDVEDVKVDIKQAIALKQEVSQTVNIITKVEKEIADIKEAIQQIYQNYQGELFGQDAMGEKVKAFAGESISVVYFQLNTVPIKKSVLITHEKGVASPVTRMIHHNIVIYRTTKKLEEILKEDKGFFFISYFPDFDSKVELLTLERMVYQGTKENPNLATFQKLVIQDE